MGRLVKSLITASALWFVNKFRRISIELVEIEAAKHYLTFISGARRGAQSVLVFWLCLFCFALGIVLLHAGALLGLYLLTDNLAAVAATLIILGGFYVVVIGLIASKLLSEQTWMHLFKADKVVENLTAKNK